jgi:prolyl oligopeptidase
LNCYERFKCVDPFAEPLHEAIQDFHGLIERLGAMLGEHRGLFEALNPIGMVRGGGGHRPISIARSRGGIGRMLGAMKKASSGVSETACIKASECERRRVAAGAMIAALIGGFVGFSGCAELGINRRVEVPAQAQPMAGLRTPPSTPKQPVMDNYHGTRITDDYRWLENWEDSKVKAWSESQNQYARSYLDELPAEEGLRARLTEILSASGVRYSNLKEAGGVYFAAKTQPPLQQPLIVALARLSPEEGADGLGERVILDPNALDTGGGVSFDWYEPSPDGTMIAVSLSEGGSESGDVHIYDVVTGQERVGDRVPRVNGGTAGGSLSWLANSSGFFYSRYPRAGDRPEADMMFFVQVYSHTLGTPTSADRYETGKDYPKIASVHVEGDPTGRWAVTNIQKGDGGEFLQDLRMPDGTWHRLGNYEDRIVEAKFGLDDALYLVSRKNAPMGKVLRLAMDTGGKNGGRGGVPTLEMATEIIPEQSGASIETSFYERTGLYLGPNRMYVQYQVGGPNELRVFDLAGSPVMTLPTLPISTTEAIEPLADGAIFSNESYIQPAAWYRFNSKLGKVTKTALAVAPPPSMPELKVERAMATSKDGTKVPVNIIMRADLVKTGQTPTVLWGYGGYGVSETPGFSPRRLTWLEQGGIFAVANIRGGGEFGERWHREGNLLNKQNVFDDYRAACQYLFDAGYTTPEKFAIFGGSNGGLLMGATITQNPGIAKAVVSSVGIYDMLRVELSANGEFNTTEFGTVKDKAQFDALHAYSPYHRVKGGTNYPAILMLTGANDPRVDPMQSRKMTARLQAASPETLTLLRTSGNTGHGSGTPLSAQIEQAVDTYGFLMWQLGLEFKALR